jgi:DNA-binding cell septation regulator SpoVG
MDIKIINIEKVDYSPNLKYLIDVQIGEIITRNWRVVKDRSGKVFVASPQVNVYDESGNKRRKTLISVPANIRESIEHLIFSNITMEDDNGDKRQ